MNKKGLSPQIKKQYNKVPLEKSQKLNELVFVAGYKIKDAAEELQLNYATAKNIVRKFRRTQIRKMVQTVPGTKRCSYKPINNQSNNIQILSQIFGEAMKYFSQTNQQQQ